MRYLLGVDSGGTFTDFVLNDGNNVCEHKVLSTPFAPEQAILRGIDDLGLAEPMRAGLLTVLHGTTVATNAVLERKLARTLFVTNQGFEDLLTIGRQARRELYNLSPIRERPPVPRALCVGIGARVAADGSELSPMEQADIDRVVQLAQEQQVEAIAISLLFAFRNPVHEQALQAALLAEPSLAGLPVYCSSGVLPVHREFERSMAVFLNAALAPAMRTYLSRLQQAIQPSSLWVMQSSGELVSASRAVDHSVRLLLSGPAGGLAAARAVGNDTGRQSLLTFDMGGTSTDVAVIDGGFAMADGACVGDWPIAVPQVDIHTIGAGGGSLVHIDGGGVLHVGPESAGADPGPVCYGAGGKQLTVTDANVYLGRIGAHFFAPRGQPLDVAAVAHAMAELAATHRMTPVALANGIIQLADEKMAAALRFVALQRGLDVRAHSLVCFGGAGGLHACGIARLLGIRHILVPARSGVFSALGMLQAKRGQQFSESLFGLDITDDTLCLCCERLRTRALEENQLYTSFRYFLDMRYRGQDATLPIEWQAGTSFADCKAAFTNAHAARYGHHFELPVEVAILRLLAEERAEPFVLPAPHNEAANDQDAVHGIPVWRRGQLRVDEENLGPLIVRDDVATIWVADGWRCRRDRQGHLHLHGVA